jgi:uncharacterized protein (DUF2252 family)
MGDVATKIKAFNAGRDPDRLALKLKKMRGDPFVFLRGSCHLFYERLPQETLFSQAPISWICGDLHLENFGSFKGDNRLVYFDINDFDEAILAPCTLDLVRFLVSVKLGARSLSVNAKEADLLCRTFIDTYTSALADGKARWVERETSIGLIQDLLDSVKLRSRVKLLDSRTEVKGKRRRIRCDGKKALVVDEVCRESLVNLVAQFAATQPDPKFFNVIDVGRRIAGTGSLGMERYIVLVEGKGSPDTNYLLDLKQAVPSSLLQQSTVKQPNWPSEAERVVTLQKRMQAIPLAFLHAVQLGGSSYILRGLQPSEDRVSLSCWNGKLHRLEEIITTMAEVTAWAHLRSAGRQGSVNVDEFAAFGQRNDWQKHLIEAGNAATVAVMSDWQAYAKPFDQGFFT